MFLESDQLPTLQECVRLSNKSKVCNGFRYLHHHIGSIRLLDVDHTTLKTFQRARKLGDHVLLPKIGEAFKPLAGTELPCSADLTFCRSDSHSTTAMVVKGAEQQHAITVNVNTLTDKAIRTDPTDSHLVAPKRGVYLQRAMKRDRTNYSRNPAHCNSRSGSDGNSLISTR